MGRLVRGVFCVGLRDFSHTGRVLHGIVAVAVVGSVSTGPRQYVLDNLGIRLMGL